MKHVVSWKSPNFAGTVVEIQKEEGNRVTCTYSNSFVPNGSLIYVHKSLLIPYHNKFQSKFHRTLSRLIWKFWEKPLDELSRLFRYANL